MRRINVFNFAPESELLSVSAFLTRNKHWLLLERMYGLLGYYYYLSYIPILLEVLLWFVEILLWYTGHEVVLLVHLLNKYSALMHYPTSSIFIVSRIKSPSLRIVVFHSAINYYQRSAMWFRLKPRWQCCPWDAETRNNSHQLHQWENHSSKQSHFWACSWFWMWCRFFFPMRGEERGLLRTSVLVCFLL